MDLNYLFHRQQVERTRAEAARSAEARRAHQQLARHYEARISLLSEGRIVFRCPDGRAPLVGGGVRP